MLKSVYNKIEVRLTFTNLAQFEKCLTEFNEMNQLSIEHCLIYRQMAKNYDNTPRATDHVDKVYTNTPALDVFTTVSHGTIKKCQMLSVNS